MAAREAAGLPFFVDTATFKALDDPDRSYVEIYILLSSKSLEFDQRAEEYWGQYGVQATLLDSGGVEMWSKQWQKEIVRSAIENQDDSYSIFDIAGLLLEPDFYDLHVNLTDQISGNKGFVSGELYVPAFPQDTLAISQLELALDIAAAQEEGDFVKNGLRVLPNPTRTYGPLVPVLYYYVEIYGLMVGPELDSTYTIRQEILATSGELLKSYQPKTEKKPGRTCVEAGGINVVGLNPETYFCRISVRDNASGMEAVNQRWFRLSRPPEKEIAAVPERLILTQEEAEHHQNVIRYVATDRELKIYKSLHLEGKSRFLEDFWGGRDPDPSTPENEFRQEHLRRWNYANQQFSRFQQDDGWKSDRGRIYILYGPPDDIERHPSDITAVAWERWHYYSIGGGIEFIFADLSGFDNYVLLHSTAKGEPRDPSWPDKVSRAPIGP